MKKLIMYFYILLYTATVYAGDISVQEEINEDVFISGTYTTDYISIDSSGVIAYVIDEKAINTLVIKLENILNQNNVIQQNIEESKNELRPVKDFRYRISLYADDESGKQTMRFLIYNTGELNVIVNDTKMTKIQLSDEERNQLLSITEMLFTSQQKYEAFLLLNNTNLTELGAVLDSKLYAFENAFIDSQGNLYISLEDWNAMFSPTYGSTKELSVRNNEVVYNYNSIGVEGKKMKDKVYLPLRETIEFFAQFDLKWDAQLRKVIISERA